MTRPLTPSGYERRLRQGPERRGRPKAASRSSEETVALAASRTIRQLLTADLSPLPAENFGTVAAGMCTFSVGLRGLTPIRAARFAVENLPNPVNVTSPLPFSVSVIGLEERVDGLAGVAVRQLRAAGHLGNELLLRHSLLQS